MKPEMIDYEKIVLTLERWIDPRNIMGILRTSAGATHDTFEVKTVNNSLFLRIYNTSDVSKIQNEHQLLRVLRDTDIPAVKLLETKAGLSYIKNDGRYYSLYEGLDGFQIEKGDISVEHARSSAIALARLHAVLRVLPQGNFHSWKLKWDGNIWVERFDKIIDAIGKNKLMGEADQIALERSRAQQQWLRDKKCAHQYIFNSSSQIIHGDFHHQNLFFKQNNMVSGILDWDSAMWMPRAYELVRACAFMFDLDVLLSKAFILAYMENSDLNLDELQDGALGWACFSDHHVWPLEEKYLKRNLAAGVFIPNKPFVPFEKSWRKVREMLNES